MMKNQESTNVEDISDKKKEELPFLNYCYLKGESYPDPKTVNYWKEKDNRFLFIFEEITEKHLSIIKWILYWNQQDNLNNIPVSERKPIKIFINSVGGLLNEAFAICDAITLSKTPVYGINTQQCSSAAALIYAHCHKRFAYPHSYFLLHLGTGGTGGTFQQSKAQMGHWEMVIKEMKTMFIKKLNLYNCQNFDDLINTEWYLYVSEFADDKHKAINYNLVDYVCNNYDIFLN